MPAQPSVGPDLCKIICIVGRAVSGIINPVYKNAENVNFTKRLEAATKGFQSC